MEINATKKIVVRGKQASFLTGPSGYRDDWETLLLIHGSGASSLTWLFQLHELDRDMNVIAVDMPGHGESEGGPFSKVEEYAAWITAFIETMNIEPCFVLGHSLGGAIIQKMAFDNKDKLKGLILVGTGVRLRVLPKILEGITDNFEKTVQFVVKSCYTNDVNQDYIRQGIALAKNIGPSVFLANFHACNEFDGTREINTINLPTQIIVGGDDIMTPVKYSEYLHKNIKGSKLTILKNAGHCVMHQRPVAFTETVRAFVKEHSSLYG